MDAHTALICTGKTSGLLAKENSGFTPYYSDRERAALAWTESVTNIQKGHVPDEVYEEVRRFFAEKELVDLTLAITVITSHCDQIRTRCISAC
jgi:alkylhydroperoxidase family enzyme